MQSCMELEYTPVCLAPALSIEALYSFHYYQYAPTYVGIVERHDFWEMVYADSGSIICNAEGREIKLVQGQALFHPPMETHSVVAQGSSGNACILSFACPRLEPALFRGRVIALNRLERELVSAIYAEGRRLFEPPYNAAVQTRLLARPDAPFGCAQLMRSYLEALMVQLTRDLQTGAPQKGAGEPRRPAYRRTHFGAETITQRVVDYLEANLEGRLTLRDISQALSFSESHLQSAFKKQTGQSIIHYFNGMKIERAKALIAGGQYTFTQIGGMLGFGSVHYFSRVFKAHMHMSPSEYERSVRLGALL